VDSLDLRARRHAALGDTTRLAIVEELARSDRAPVELQRIVGVPSNLLAHHLEVLEDVGLISRGRSSGDGRRRYVTLHRSTLDGLVVTGRPACRALFVCTHNSARSQLAAALWQQLTDAPADSAGTHPAQRVHPGAVAAARRVGLDLSATRPKRLDDVEAGGALVVTVCDRAHEELDGDGTWLHWSVPDPVAAPSSALSS
jgi:protein-tyrosine-phosphatase